MQNIIPIPGRRTSSLARVMFDFTTAQLYRPRSGLKTFVMRSTDHPSD